MEPVQEQPHGPWRPLGSGVLTPDEEQLLVLALAAYRGDEGFTADDVRRLIAWAEMVIVEKHLLDTVFRGHAVVALDDAGEPCFRLTEAGLREAERLLAAEEASRAEPDASRPGAGAPAAHPGRPAADPGSGPRMSGGGACRG